MPTLAINNAEIKESLALILGANRDEGEWDDQIFADVNRVIRAGRRKFFMASDWSFLESNIQFVTEAPLTLTGSCVNGTITITAGTVPDPAIGYYKVAPQTDGNVYDIASSFPTSIVLVDTSVTFTDQSIILYRYAYDLPTNFSAFIDPVVVENNADDSTQLSEYATLPDFQVTGSLNRNRIVTGFPEIFATTQAVDAETGDFSFFLLVYPFPAAATTYVIKSRIRIYPGDALDEPGDIFHPVFSELMSEAIYAQAEIMFKGQPGVHTQLFGSLLPAAIKRDREMRGVRRLLPRANTSLLSPNAEIRRAEITFRPGTILP